jgi:hypothetical protein
MTDQQEIRNNKIQELAARFYLQLDVTKMLDVPGRQELKDASFNEFEALGEELQENGATIETHTSSSLLEASRHIVVYPNGMPLGATHNRLDTEHMVSRMIEAADGTH